MTCWGRCHPLVQIIGMELKLPPWWYNPYIWIWWKKNLMLQSWMLHPQLMCCSETSALACSSWVLRCPYLGTNPALSVHPITWSFFFLSWSSSTVFVLLLPNCIHLQNTYSLQPSSVLSPHFPSQSLQRPNLLTLLLSPTGSAWFFERANRNWEAGFQVPFYFYIIPCFCKSLNLLAACFIMVFCLACCSTLNKFLHEVSWLSTDYVALNSKRQNSSRSQLQQSQILQSKLVFDMLLSS